MKRFIDANYHSHTYRCGHAQGSDEEYVVAAIENGFKILGVTDHIFLPNISQRGMRGDFSELKGYVVSLEKLREKYKDKIELHIGFEAEWYGERYKDYYEWLLKTGVVEYLILGNHMTIINKSEDDDTPVALNYGAMKDEKLATKMYVDSLIEGMESGLFTYVAHPDFFHYWYGEWDEYIEKESKRIIDAAIRLDIPLEINMGPSRFLKNGIKEDELVYPWNKFWDLVANTKAKCICGVDAHNPNNYYETDYGFFKQFIAKRKLNLIKRVDLVNPFKNK